MGGEVTFPCPDGPGEFTRIRSDYTAVKVLKDNSTDQIEFTGIISIKQHPSDNYKHGLLLEDIRAVSGMFA